MHQPAWVLTVLQLLFQEPESKIFFAVGQTDRARLMAARHVTACTFSHLECKVTCQRLSAPHPRQIAEHSIPSRVTGVRR